MPELEINGVRLHYTDEGKGAETVVFSHGLLWSGRMYDAQVAHFRERYRCITFDFRGQGQSEVTETGYDMDTLAQDAALLIERLSVAPCHFVGLSMGGFIGLRLGIRRPELLRSLVILESAADPEPWINGPKYRAMLMGARVVGLGPFVPTVMKIMFGDAFLHSATHASMRSEMERRLLANDLQGLTRATIGVIERNSVESELGRIRTPTLVLSGEGDRAVVSARSRRTAALIPGASFESLPRAGHTSTVEEPELVNTALDRFWKGLGRPAAVSG
jgi:pimeloyl-ACP methyl ester carboxylesterase